jgi:small subunit ribosomal protein S2
MNKAEESTQKENHMAAVTMKDLLEAGVHFGHRTRRWNPKMRPYIFTERSGIHIIDLQQTLIQLNNAAKTVRDTVAKGGLVLFVGTKRQAQATIQAEADRCNMPYVSQRWLGGTLTNWNTIRQRIDYLLQLERRMDAGEFRNYTKKERLSIQREVEKLNRRIGGLKVMRRLPELVFVVDTSLEELAVTESSRMHIPIVGMVDTNADPSNIDFVIPSNDDAIRSVKLIVNVIANAAEEGLRIREVEMVDTGQVSKNELAEMERYLGPSTLAKLQSADDEDFEEYRVDDDEVDDDDEVEDEDEDEDEPVDSASESLDDDDDVSEDEADEVDDDEAE